MSEQADRVAEEEEARLASARSQVRVVECSDTYVLVLLAREMKDDAGQETRGTTERREKMQASAQAQAQTQKQSTTHACHPWHATGIHRESHKRAHTNPSSHM